MNVFQDLRDAFHQAVENFKRELDRDRVPENVDELLRGMKGELVDARARVRALEEDIREALRQAESEEEEAATCRRREEMAREIGDDETARVASEYAEKHERRQRVLERKALALKEELDLRRSEAEEMLDRLQEARTRREELAAKVGRAQARGSLREADDLFAELDRMAEKIGDDERRSRAARELEDEMEDAVGPSPTSERDADAEARLRELKRRMERTDDG